MKKIINLEISTCQECPYCQYDSSYGRCHDSGYDCHHGDVLVHPRIVDDWEVANDNNPNPKGWPPIPEWCPLPNK